MKEKGITLIALVITIIVLLILAGISIAMLTGDNGLLTKASTAKEATRGAAVEEAVSLWSMERTTNKITGSGTAKTAEQLIDSLGPDGDKLLTAEECTKLKNKETITIGGRSIEITDALTLGDVYTDDMIGQKLSYSACGENNWIVFGKDEDGNILLTTERPTSAGYEVRGTAEAWLNYEGGLKSRCGIFGGTVDGVTVEARSITMDDINYVSGFQKPKFEKFTFGSTHGWNSTENKWDSYNVNYWYPSLNSTNFFQDPSVKSAELENSAYYYGYESGKLVSMYLKDSKNVVNEETELNEERLKYILGEDNSYYYLVASRSVGVTPDKAGFCIGFVSQGVSISGGYTLCFSFPSGGVDYSDGGVAPVRPVVILPSSIQVEEKENGSYDFLEAGGNSETNPGEPKAGE